MSIPSHYKLTFDVLGTTHDGYCSDPYDFAECSFSKVDCYANTKGWTASQMMQMDVSEFDYSEDCCYGSGVCDCHMTFTCTKIEPCDQSK